MGRGEIGWVGGLALQGPTSTPNSPQKEEAQPPEFMSIQILHTKRPVVFPHLVAHR